MSVLPVGFGSSGGIDVGDIGHSLRLRAAASAYLSRTFGVPTDAKKFTVSLWLKLSSYTTSFTPIWGTPSGTGASGDGIYLRETAPDTRLSVFLGGATYEIKTSQVIRDPSAWCHIVVVVDTANATGGDRLRLYINGSEVTSFATDANPSLGYTPPEWNANTKVQYIGASGSPAAYLDGYLSRICFVDGQALTPSSFGTTNSTINEWVSKSQSAVKAAVDAGGTNSCMLDFDDATSLTILGYDKSNKGNNWTLTNVSLTAGVTYDHMSDVPGNSHWTLNPLANAPLSSVTFKNANLGVTTSTSRQHILASFRLGQDNKHYWECSRGNASAGGYQTCGIAAINAAISSSPNYSYPYNVWGYQNAGAKAANGASSGSYTASSSTSDVWGFDWDGPNSTLTCYLNDVSLFSITGLTGEYVPYFGIETPCDIWVNFGQRAYAYTHANFEALCQANLPDVDVDLLDPTDHHIEILVTKSGNTNFTIPWNADTYDTFFEIKRRDAAGDWYQIDGLRGYTKILKSNGTAAETTDANVLGISGTTGTLKSTLADGTYVVSCTKAGLTASRQTNTDGSITSTVSRNVDSGFSIVTCTGTAANATVGHGLGAVLKTIIAKATGAVTEWPVYNAALANTEYLVLNTTAAKATGATYWNSTTPTTTVFSLGSSTNTNNSGGMVFYCYADSAIQKSFSYTAAASADGPYVNLGFKPASTLHKVVTAGDNWASLNAAIYPSNAVTTYLYRNGTAGDTSITSGTVDLNATGIKIRTPADGMGSAQTIIGHAWAAVTGKYSNAR